MTTFGKVILILLGAWLALGIFGGVIGMGQIELAVYFVIVASVVTLVVRRDSKQRRATHQPR